MYKVQYLSRIKKDKIWRYVRGLDNITLTFQSIHDARYCMRRCYLMGFDARITTVDENGNNIWVERMER